MEFTMILATSVYSSLVGEGLFVIPVLAVFLAGVATRRLRRRTIRLLRTGMLLTGSMLVVAFPHDIPVTLFANGASVVVVSLGDKHSRRRRKVPASRRSHLRGGRPKRSSVRHGRTEGPSVTDLLRPVLLAFPSRSWLPAFPL